MEIGRKKKKRKKNLLVSLFLGHEFTNQAKPPIL